MHRLALALGKSIRELLATMDSRELTSWLAYERIDPFGPIRQDLRFAMLLSLLANIHRDPSKRPQPFTLEDFLLKFDTEENEAPTDEAVERYAKLLHMIYGEGKG